MQGKNYLHSIRQVCPRWLYLILCATQPFIPKKLGGNLKRQTNKYQEGWKNYHNVKYLYHLVNTSRTTSKNNRMVIGSRNTLTWSANKRQIYISCWKKKTPKTVLDNLILQFRPQVVKEYSTNYTLLDKVVVNILLQTFNLQIVWKGKVCVTVRDLANHEA